LFTTHLAEELAELPDDITSFINLVQDTVRDDNELYYHQIRDPSSDTYSSSSSSQHYFDSYPGGTAVMSAPRAPRVVCNPVQPGKSRETCTDGDYEPYLR
jgi:hypothetical protein